MRVPAVCGRGIGTSIILKINAERALRELDIEAEAEVEVADIGVARGQAAGADLVITAPELADQLGEVEPPVVRVTNFVDQSELSSKIRETLQR